MINSLARTLAATALLSCLSATASASLVGATENFDSDSANWLNAPATSFLDWFPTGGADGGGYASGVFNLASTNAGDTPVILRARSAANSSNNIFFGDYITEGVTELRFQFRHNAPDPVTVFTRFAASPNFPGAIAVHFTPVLANTWTELIVAIDPDNPAFISFSGSDFNTVFSSIGQLQFGVMADSALAGVDQEFRFDIDNVRLVPAPGAGAALASLGLLGVARRRRQR